jgi:hypothetical protein
MIELVEDAVVDMRQGGKDASRESLPIFADDIEAGLAAGIRGSPNSTACRTSGTIFFGSPSTM